jgi:hypothetical protein
VAPFSDLIGEENTPWRARRRFTMSLKMPRLTVGVMLAFLAPGMSAAQEIAVAVRGLADSPTAQRKLLPAAPSATPCLMSWNNDDLAQVPEVQLNEAWSVQGVREWTAQQIARISFLNEIEEDHFTRLLREHRPDLAGLPFIVGDAGRLGMADRGRFEEAVRPLRQSLGQPLSREAFWKGRPVPEDPSKVAALTQMLATDTGLTPGLIEHLAQSDNKEATQALARLAVFAPDDWVRQAARAALQLRDTGPATGILVRGLRYPWPAVARHAAEAVAQLERTDLALELANMLREPDPRAPVLREIDGQQVHVVRELVRINHLRNCLLCHPPANTSDRGPLARGIPAPRKESPRWDDSNAVFHGRVRADVTYLRQDFSVLQNVAGSDPGPARQRFDYLVRERTLTDQEARAYRAELAANRNPSPYRLAARQALHELALGKGNAIAIWIALGCTSLVVLQGPFLFWLRRRQTLPRPAVSFPNSNPSHPQ